MSSNVLQGFQVIGCRFSTSYSIQHELFVKEHSVRNQSEDKPAGRTLFIVNIPPWATEESFKRVFSVVGPVKSVTFHRIVKDTRAPCSFNSGFVVFEKSADLQKALKLTALDPLSTQNEPILTGLRKWIKEYNDSIMNTEKLRKQVNDIIKKYDKEESKKSKVKEQTDDEGWTLITKKGRNPGVSRTESNESRLQEKLSKKLGLKNFYRFQIKENKMNEIAALRKRHDEDKKKIEAIKRARKFKPY